MNLFTLQLELIASHPHRHLLNNVDVGRFGSTYTVLNANDGRILVNTTNQLSDLYTRWNESVHQSRMFCPHH